VALAVIASACQYSYSLSAEMTSRGWVLHSDQEKRESLLGPPPLCLDGIVISQANRTVWAFHSPDAENGLKCRLRFPLAYGATPTAVIIDTPPEPIERGLTYHVQATGYGGSGDGYFRAP
jgi:hypothetical protein